MTAQEIIAAVDAVKPNAFDNASKLRWLNALEGRIHTEVRLESIEDFEPLALTDTPSITAPYDDLYEYWLKARIDEANGEYDRYQATSAMFNGVWNEYVCWYAQNYDPVQR